MAERLLTIAEVAIMLGVGTMWVRTLDDQLKPIRIGKNNQRIYTWSSVEALRKEREKKAKAKARERAQ